MTQWAAPPTYYLTRWLFLRLLAAVYLVAFLSLWVQVDGLIGRRGLLPAADFLESAAGQLGQDRYWLLPTLCWIDASDPFIHALCGAGVLLSVLLMAGVAPVAALLGLWAIYLSLVVVGQSFLSFQWDVLLLETGLAATFLAPAAIWPQWPWRQPPPARSALWLLWLLLFKLMFLSGIVKLISMDETWWSLTALDYHYFTQPLPAWTSWYAHRFPEWFQRASVFVMFLIEIAVPFLIFAGRMSRRVACAALLLLQALIAATGNYGFFNLLAGVLCLTLIDDAVLYSLLPERIRERHRGRIALAPRWLPRGAITALLVLVFLLLSGLALVREMVRTQPPAGVGGIAGKLLDGGERYLLSWGEPYLLSYVTPFRSLNGYGLFRAMTTERLEIVLEGSSDGRSWIDYPFRFKPGDPLRRPRFVAPHQPRLDWQMWFAALDPRGAAVWLQALVRRILEGAPEVLELLGPNPFPEGVPRYVRLAYYRYEFTTAEERRVTGAWWKRQRRRDLTGAISLGSLPAQESP